jgi:hypothetical protein
MYKSLHWLLTFSHCDKQAAAVRPNYRRESLGSPLSAELTIAMTDSGMLGERLNSACSLRALRLLHTSAAYAIAINSQTAAAERKKLSSVPSQSASGSFIGRGPCLALSAPCWRISGGVVCGCSCHASAHVRHRDNDLLNPLCS